MRVVGGAGVTGGGGGDGAAVEVEVEVDEEAGCGGGMEAAAGAADMPVTERRHSTVATVAKAAKARWWGCTGWQPHRLTAWRERQQHKNQDVM